MYINFWYPICTAESLDEENPQRVELLGVRLVAFRDEAGTAHVLSDTCIHRGGSLGKGKVMGGVFNLVAGFDLEDAGNGETLVKWDGELVMFGKLMSMAGGMIRPIANKDIATLIEAIRIALGGEEEVAAPAVEAEPKVGWLRAFMNKLASIVRGILRIGK